MPNALELTPEGWAPYLKRSSRRPAPSTLSVSEEQERDQLLERIYNAGKALKERYITR